MTTRPLAATAYAKVNLALAVYPPTADGYHPLRGLFQSVSLADSVRLLPADDDAITVSNDEAPSDESNLAWIALDAMRHLARMPTAVRLDILKRIPAGSGLGGGSADAAAVIGLLTDVYGVDPTEAREVAASIGADVPFALRGGTGIVAGRGERIESTEPLDGFAIAIVVPPFPLSTPAVFRKWDELDAPDGPVISDAALPPELRGREPIRNDLYPAAVALDPRIAEWVDELSSLWATEVAMTGSGSALFAYFADRDEADAAAAAVTTPSRIATGASLRSVGWEPVDA